LNSKNHILFLLSCLIGFTGIGQSIQFIENKGQWDPSIRYLGEVNGGAFYIQQNGFTVLQHHPKDWAAIGERSHKHGHSAKPLEANEKMTLRSHAYKVEFLGANASPQIIPDKPVFTYNNYFIGDDPSRWAENCKIYQGITMKDIYPGIDVRYYSDNGTMKYDIIVHPGADPSVIGLRYNGADKLEIKNKELIIKTSVGDLKELSPYSYQYNNNGRSDVNVKFALEKNTVRFSMKGHDPKSTLVIDPSLIFCSFSGTSPSDNWGFTATYGPDGSMFGGGNVWGSGWPVFTPGPGPIQTSFGGGNFDIGIIKLSPDGSSRLYATYIGGNKEDQPHSLVVDGAGNLVLAGRSNSTNYPVTGVGVHGPGGDYDIVVTKLSPTGSIVGSKRVGGTGKDGVNISENKTNSSLQRNYGDDGRSEVILDGANNIYVASSTHSDNFLVQGGFQPTFGGGLQDGVILKFDPNVNTLLFSSYLGGTANDAAYVLSIRPGTNQIYVAGGTESSDMVPSGISAGTIGPANAGVIDGYVAVISNDGSQIQNFSYIGTSSIDQVYGVQFDRFGFPYIMGQTTGDWPVINAAWSQGGGKQFIAKLNPDLSAYVYSTKFGSGASTPNISPVAFLIDRCENVYVSGWGGDFPNPPNFPMAGVTGLTVTPDALKSTPDIGANGKGADFYFFVLKKDAASQLYGSFFGQNNGAPDHVDGGTSRFDRNGVIYQAVCGNCKYIPGATNIPTTPGAWSVNNPSTSGGECNLMMIKISFDLAGVAGGVQSTINGVPRDTAGCVPLTVVFRDTVQVATSYEWNFGDGSPVVTTTNPSISHTYTALGTYRVMMVAIDSSTCNIRDTSYQNILVGSIEALLDFNPVKLPTPCTVFSFRFDNLSSAPSTHPFSNKAFEWDFGDGSPRVIAGLNSVTHTYATAGTYNVTLKLLDSVYCNFPDTIVKQLRVAANVVADFFTPATGCAPYDATFTNESQGGQQFQWDFGDGNTSTDVSPQHLYTTPGTYIVTLIAIDSNTCNITDTTRQTITIYSLPTADFTASPQPAQINTPITFTNRSSVDAIRFKWLFGDGDSLVTTSRAPVQHEYNATRTYDACLIAYNINDCADTTCLQVANIIEPAVDVPTAFTPQSGDINSMVFVRGFGIAKMKFTIWSRWGERVFETNDKRIGWDGKFKGKLLPMDVYAYTLEVEFSDGTRANKKGDITLIR
jgi:gliding motility-associated-like protein